MNLFASMKKATFVNLILVVLVCNSIRVFAEDSLEQMVFENSLSPYISSQPIDLLFKSPKSLLKSTQGSQKDAPLKSDVIYIPKYNAGQGGVGLGAGVLFPLFFQSFTGDVFDTKLSIGGYVWFDWDIFLWKALSTGMEIAGTFTLTPNSRTLFMAPITAHLKYTFQAYPVEFPVSFALGINMSSVEDAFKADFIFKPKVGSSYRINQNWVLGLFTSYWFIVQSYDNTTLGSKYSMLGNFLDVTVGFSYVF